MFKIFHLKTIDKDSGIVFSATLSQRLAWLFSGCPIRDRKVIDRFIQKKHKQKKAILNDGVSLSSNTFSLPST